MISKLSSKEFSLLQHFIESKCGINIGEDKAYLIESKLSFLLAESGLSSFEELYLKICNDRNQGMTEDIIDAITINETFWFRDKTPWNILQDLLLPTYIDEIRSGKRTKVRIWSTACSYGQEPYSIAMCVDHYLTRLDIVDVNLSHFEIIATDISKTVLQMASFARYDSVSISRGLDDGYKAKYFINEGRVWTLIEKIKNAVSFKYFNLQNDYVLLGKFDIIFCRNVLIYFGERLKKEVINKIAAGLMPNGLFIIGS